MKRIGEINYSTLEDDLEKHWPNVHIYRDDDNPYDFTFLWVPDKKLRGEGIPGLPLIMKDVVERLYKCFLPVFEDRDLFRVIVEEIICERTFFEHKDLFQLKHEPDSGDKGMYYPYPLPLDDKTIKPGSHVKIFKNIHDIDETLLHEYGHEMHYQSCKFGKASFYKRYDDVMNEVMAIALEGRNV